MPSGYCVLAVRYWPLADMGSCTAHVCCRWNSGHDLWRESAFVVAIGAKADIAWTSHFFSFLLARSDR